MTDVDVAGDPLGQPSDGGSTGAEPSGADAAGAISYWVTLLGGAVFNGLNKAFTPFEISPVQYLILYMCHRRRFTTVSGIAQISPHDASTISRNVEQLRARGLMTTYRSKPDRRVLHLAVTEEGRSLMAELIAVAKDVEAEITQGVSDRDRTRVIGAMRKMVMGERVGDRRIP